MFTYAATSALAQDKVEIKVDATKTTTEISKSLYGIFFEEINSAGEGGLFGELLQGSGMNGARDGKLPLGWFGENATFDASEKMNANRPGSIRLTGKSWMENRGFNGIKMPDGRFKFSISAKTDVPLIVQAETPFGPVKIAMVAPEDDWQSVEVITHLNSETLKSIRIERDAETGSSAIGYVSFTSERNLFRGDLADKVSAMKPSFVRFPGGCFVEGEDWNRMWRWKDSIGPIAQRKGMEASFWGYPISNGLGFHEYLQWCESLDAAPLFVANVGMNHSQITPIGEMDQRVDNVLDAIEYANGPASSKWGAERVRNGHPDPFNLKYVEIGNENGYGWSFGGPQPYYDRYKILHDAIKAKYPGIVCIADVPVPHPTDLIDEHYYMSPAWFWANSHKYDTYDRKGPKIYVGEYAVTQGCGTGNLDAALGEAAFMTGMERNSDVVTMSSYAPLFVNVNNKQWNPDAIVFDATRSYGTPSYWVQALFGQNRPDVNVSTTLSTPKVATAPISGSVGLQTWKTQAEFKDFRVTADDNVIFDPAVLTRIAGGSWSYSDDVLKQTSEEENRRIYFPLIEYRGAKKLVFELKARKIVGAEGFIIMFDSKGDDHAMQWNVGGWGNRQNAFQSDGAVIEPMQKGSIETGKWYDIRIEREAGKARAYLDGKLVQSMSDPAQPDFTAIAGIDRTANELVLKVVNGSEYSRIANLTLEGVLTGSTGKGVVLKGTSLDEENSFAEPMKIAPQSLVIKGVSDRMTTTFEARSLTILRIPLKAKRNQ